MNTKCENCIFADYTDSKEPCKLNILEQIKDYHTPTISDNNFYIIPDYRCRYGFDIDTYDQHKDQIGTITDLQKHLETRTQISYYLIVNVTNPSLIKDVCLSITQLVVVPKFVSFILYQSNNIENIIQQIKSRLDSSIEWKVHNFLEHKSLNESISVIFDTNANKNNSAYFWINDDTTHLMWQTELSVINKTIYLYQPKCHGLFRDTSKNGMFLSFKLYKDMKTHLSSDIFRAFDLLESPKFIYYA